LPVVALPEAAPTRRPSAPRGTGSLPQVHGVRERLLRQWPLPRATSRPQPPHPGHAMLAFLAAVSLAATAQPPARTDLHGDPLPPGASVRLGTARLRGVHEVKGVAFSPDARSIASRHGTGVQLWDAATGKELWLGTPGYHPGSPMSFTDDGTLLLTTG